MMNERLNVLNIFETGIKEEAQRLFYLITLHYYIVIWLQYHYVQAKTILTGRQSDTESTMLGGLKKLFGGIMVSICGSG